MNPHEEALLIPGPDAGMLGIVSRPAQGQPMERTGVVIVVGGAQYRAGSHRMFVQLARHLATAGYPVLRFDLPGMGDSPGEPVSFEDTAPHIGAAFSALQAQQPGLDRVVLWGLCDGASACLLYLQATQDPRVSGLALLNPWVRSETSLAQARVKHYYRQRLREPDFWRKLLLGGVGWQALQGMATNLRRMRQPQESRGFQDRMAQGLRGFRGRVLLLLSETDLTAQEFQEQALNQAAWVEAMLQASVTRCVLPLADHTCSSLESTRRLEAETLNWLGTQA